MVITRKLRGDETHRLHPSIEERTRECSHFEPQSLSR